MKNQTTSLAALILIALSVGAIASGAAPIDGGPRNWTVSPPGDWSSEVDDQIKVNVSLVNILVTVFGKNHEILPNLEQDNFKIYENSKEQRIAVFSRKATAPITVGLLIDTSWSERHKILIEQEGASAFAHKLFDAGTEGMTLDFDTDVNLLADFTQDTSIIDRAIQQSEVESPAGIAQTRLYDAVYLGCNRLREQAGRKILVVFTDGDDYGSKVTLEDAVRTAQHTDTAIYVLLIADPRFSSGYGFGSRGEVVAKTMTDETGGRTIEVRNEANLTETVDELAEEIHSQYVLGYYPLNSRHDGTFRKIKIRTNVPGTTVVTRRGYYASGR